MKWLIVIGVARIPVKNLNSPALYPEQCDGCEYSVRSTDPDTVDFNVTQVPTLVDNLILCASGAGPLAWTIADDVTIEVIYTFT